MVCLLDSIRVYQMVFTERMKDMGYNYVQEHL